MVVIGRDREKALLENAYASERSECIALYGRRRVGKTYLVRNFFLDKECLFFELVGQKKENGEIASVQHQLANFQYAWQKAFNESVAKPASWDAAFRILKMKVDKLSPSGKKIVIFIDELPWLCSPNSRFFENLDQAWNACFEPATRVKMILCGSATTWMLKRVLYAKAGLSRRITLNLHLQPFNLSETFEYLRCKKFDLTPESVAEVYMTFGGIPYYLDFLSPQKSMYQNIEDECFKRNGHLRHEYDAIFDSLFNNAAAYKKVIEILSAKRYGLRFEEVQKLFNPQATSPSGTVHQILTNLYECDFVDKRPQLFSEKKGAIYSIADEFVLFYQKWIKPLPEASDLDGMYWQSIVGSPSYNSWIGFSFESLCLKHQALIRRALGLHKISAVPGIFYSYDKKGKRAAQIDLLFDRADKTITICEIKHCRSELELTSKDMAAIALKKQELINFLIAKRMPRKNILVAYITLHGVKRNSYFNELQPEVVRIEDLFANA